MDNDIPVETVAESLKAAAAELGDEVIIEPSVRTRARNTRKGSNGGASRASASTVQFAQSEPEPDPLSPPEGLAEQVASGLQLTLNLVADRFKVSPLTDSEAMMLGKAWAPVLHYYATEVDPVIMMWLSALGTTGFVMAPRYMEFRDKKVKEAEQIDLYDGVTGE